MLALPIPLEDNPARKRLTLQNDLWIFHRLTDAEASALAVYARAIQVPHILDVESELWGVPPGAVPISLEMMFGKSSQHFDPYKGSYAFPLLLETRRSPRVHLVRVSDHKMSFSLDLFRLEHERVPPLTPYVPLEPDTPVDAVRCLGTFVAAYAEGVRLLGTVPTAPFTRRVPSERLVYARHIRSVIEV
jgi:hypothetical protein